MKKKLIMLLASITMLICVSAAAMAAQTVPSQDGNVSMKIASRVYKTENIANVYTPVGMTKITAKVYYVPDGTQMYLPDGYDGYRADQLSKSYSYFYSSHSNYFEKDPCMGAGWKNTNSIYAVTPYTIENGKKVLSETFYFRGIARVASDSPFTDLKKTSDYFFTPVLWAYETGRTSGTSATTFSPNKTCTRAEMITFLWRASGSPEPTIKNPFKDIASSAYYYKAALWAYETGVTAGTVPGYFSPNATCTRGQAVTQMFVLYKDKVYVGSNISEHKLPQWENKSCPFTDVSSSDYFYDPVRWAYYANVTSGVGNKKFAPNAGCTRGQMITYLFACYT